MARVKVYSTGICPICDNAKNLLKKWGIPYEEARVDRDRALLKEMLTVTEGARMVPQFVIDGKWIGGFSELTMMHMDGKLDELVAKAEIPQAS
jgi:glutaredoxin 3